MKLLTGEKYHLRFQDCCARVLRWPGRVVGILCFFIQQLTNSFTRFKATAFLFSLALLLQTSLAWSQLVINEVGIAPGGGSNAHGGEFIELFNNSTSPVDIGCHVLMFSGTSNSGSPTGWAVMIPAGTTIAPHAFFLI